MGKTEGNQGRALRRRAVRLTPDALGKLQQGIADVWAREGDSRPLTRAARARLLGVSVVTANRILGGQGVDRATLRLAFEQMGLEWHDSHCVPARTEGFPGSEPEDVEPALPDREVVIRRSIRPYAWGAAVLLALLSAPLVYPAVSRSMARPTLKSTPAIPAAAVSEGWKEECARLHLLSADEYHRGDYQNARKHIEQAIALARKHNALGHAAGALKIQGDLESESGDLAKAAACYRDSLTLWRVLRLSECQAPVLEALGELEIRTGSYQAARRHLDEALAIFRKGRDATGIAMVCRDLGSLAARRRDYSAAEQWFRRSLAAAAPLPNGMPIVMDVQGRRAQMLCSLGRYEQARSLLNRCLAFWMRQTHPRWIAVSEQRLGELECLSGNFSAGRALLERSMAAFERLGDRAGAEACRSALQRTGQG